MRFIIIAVVLLAGCMPQSEPDYRPAIACEMALGSMGIAEPTPVPTPGVCDECKGTGWITHGDGHKTECPHCNGAIGPGQYGSFMGISDATKAVAKTCSKVDAAIDKLMGGGLNIKVGDEYPTLAPEVPRSPCAGGQCPVTTSVQATATVKRTYTQPKRLFWRFRR